MDQSSYTFLPIGQQHYHGGPFVSFPQESAFTLLTGGGGGNVDAVPADAFDYGRVLHSCEELKPVVSNGGNTSTDNMSSDNAHSGDNANFNICDAEPPAPKPEKMRKNTAVSPFVMKMWNIVNKPSYNKIICWDKSGRSFHILNAYIFCKSVLPVYFKHNNLNSLIRQLNMYGFSKVPVVDQGGVPTAGDYQHMHFMHSNFTRGKPHQLHLVARKTKDKTEQESGSSSSSSSNQGPQRKKHLRDSHYHNSHHFPAAGSHTGDEKTTAQPAQPQMQPQQPQGEWVESGRLDEQHEMLKQIALQISRMEKRQEELDQTLDNVISEHRTLWAKLHEHEGDSAQQQERLQRSVQTIIGTIYRKNGAIFANECQNDIGARNTHMLAIEQM